VFVGRPGDCRHGFGRDPAVLPATRFVARMTSRRIGQERSGHDEIQPSLRGHLFECSGRRAADPAGAHRELMLAVMQGPSRGGDAENRGGRVDVDNPSAVEGRDGCGGTGGYTFRGLRFRMIAMA